ncbi:hypothetical protein MRB53_022945 [Persea americana]|uniref:Uncharacterized protein n=1 Tax=Persea americana TaxID=3435 RepID=A0ACC2L804_PERAE|nr:hypothetical protein MRB53_022945 [Persea americana]
MGQSPKARQWYGCWKVYLANEDLFSNYKDLFPSSKDLHLRNMPTVEGWSSPQEDGDGDEQGRERDEQVIFQGLRAFDYLWLSKTNAYSMA